MSKFPVDAPKQRVIKSLEILGFRIIREREHISMERINPDGTKTPLTMPNHPQSHQIAEDIFHHVRGNKMLQDGSS